jgi:hypothetical protein
MLTLEQALKSIRIGTPRRHMNIPQSNSYYCKESNRYRDKTTGRYVRVVYIGAIKSN